MVILNAGIIVPQVVSSIANTLSQCAMSNDETAGPPAPPTPLRHFPPTPDDLKFHQTSVLTKP
jgi:hypothetical protein